LLVGRRWVIGRSHFTLALFVLLFLAREFSLTLFKRVVRLSQETLLKRGRPAKLTAVAARKYNNERGVNETGKGGVTLRSWAAQAGLRL